MVKLRRMMGADMTQVLDLEVTMDQRAFVDPVDETLGINECHRDNFVIEADNTIVGFFQIDRSSKRRKVTGFLELHEVQIDTRYQGKGFGKTFVKSLKKCLMREYPGTPGVCLTVNCKNMQAYELYKLGNFIDTGELYTKGKSGPQHIMRCVLDA